MHCFWAAECRHCSCFIYKHTLLQQMLLRLEQVQVGFAEGNWHLLSPQSSIGVRGELGLNPPLRINFLERKLYPNRHIKLCLSFCRYRFFRWKNIWVFYTVKCVVFTPEWTKMCLAAGLRRTRGREEEVWILSLRNPVAHTLLASAGDLWPLYFTDAYLLSLWAQDLTLTMLQRLF